MFAASEHMLINHQLVDIFFSTRRKSGNKMNLFSKTSSSRDVLRHKNK